MTVRTNGTGRFYRALATLAIIGPIFLVFAAGMLPEGNFQRGDLIVFGHEVLFAILASAVALRAAYVSGRGVERFPARSRSSTSAA